MTPTAQKDAPSPSPRQLRMLWIASLVIGAIAFAAGLGWAASDPGLDWVWAVAAFGFGAVVYNLAFFALCSAFAPALASYVSDDTETAGGDVTHVVHQRSSGDPAIDAWLGTYATARGISAMAIISVVVTVVVLVFF